MGKQKKIRKLEAEVARLQRQNRVLEADIRTILTKRPMDEDRMLVSMRYRLAYKLEESYLNDAARCQSWTATETRPK